ncbi:MAG TPA: HTTM domain-containing protein, partial [Streptomyces sp.]
LGLPFFSLAMIAADSVFLPTAFLLWLGSRAARARGRLFGTTRKGTGTTDTESTDGGGTPTDPDAPRKPHVGSPT